MSNVYLFGTWSDELAASENSHMATEQLLRGPSILAILETLMRRFRKLMPTSAVSNTKILSPSTIGDAYLNGDLMCLPLHSLFPRRTAQ